MNKLYCFLILSYIANINCKNSYQSDKKSTEISTDIRLNISLQFPEANFDSSFIHKKIGEFSSSHGDFYNKDRYVFINKKGRLLFRMNGKETCTEPRKFYRSNKIWILKSSDYEYLALRIDSIYYNNPHDIEGRYSLILVNSLSTNDTSLVNLYGYILFE